MCMWASLCLNQSKLIWMDHWIDHRSYTHDGIRSIQWCNSVQLKWNSIIWNWSTHTHIYICTCFALGVMNLIMAMLHAPIGVIQNLLIYFNTNEVINYLEWFSIDPGQMDPIYILYCDIYLMTDRASLDTRNWRMETCLSRQCHTYPARIEVMVTAEPTATPARSPICQNKNKGRQKQMGGNIWSSIYVRRRSKKSIFVTYNSQVRTTT